MEYRVNITYDDGKCESCMIKATCFTEAILKAIEESGCATIINIWISGTINV